MHNLKSTASLLVIFTIIFYAIAVFFPANRDLLPYSDIAAGVFAIFVGFSIANSRTRLNQVNEMLKTENANNLLISRLAESLSEAEQNKIRKLLDAYIIEQVDYRLEDFYKTGKSFHELYSYIAGLTPEGDKESIAVSSMLSILHASSTNRAQIETLTTHRISPFEWVSMIGLVGAVVATLYSITTNDIVQSMFITVVASSTFLLVLVLRDLNNLKWQKAIWTWRPLHNLFKDLDLIPYYPKLIVDRGEAKIENGEIVRLADYPQPYPDMKDKTIETVEYHGPKKYTAK